MKPGARWGLSWSSSIFSNAIVFGAIALLVGQAPMQKAVEAVPIRLITLPPKKIEPPKPIPRKKPKITKKKKIKQKVKPKPIKKKIVGLSKKIEPPPPPPVIEEPPPPPEPVYQPLYSLSALPTFVRQIIPEYPEGKRFSGREAKVTAEVSIDVTGAVRSIRIIKSGGEAFDNAVIEAIEKSLFTPGYQKGRPAAVRVQIPYTFKLR